MNLVTKIALAGGVILGSTFLIYIYAKDGGKKKYQIIHHSNGAMVTYDTVIPTSSTLTPEEFLAKKGISSENVEIIQIPSSSDKNIDGKGKKTIVREMEIDDNGSGDKVEINVKVNDKGQMTAKKTVNGKEVKMTDEELKEIQNHDGEHKKVVKMKIDEDTKGSKKERVEISVEMDDQGNKIIKKTVNGKEVKITSDELKKLESEMEGGQEKEIEIETSGGSDNVEKKIIKKQMDSKSGHGENNFEWVSADGSQKIMLMTTGDDEDMTLVLVTENYDEKQDGKAKVTFKQSKEEININDSQEEGPFKIRYSSQDKLDTDVTVTNEAGKKIFEEKLKKFSGKYEKEVDLEKFGPGLYTITIRNANDEQVQKIMIK